VIVPSPFVRLFSPKTSSFVYKGSKSSKSSSSKSKRRLKEDFNEHSSLSKRTNVEETENENEDVLSDSDGFDDAIDDEGASNELVDLTDLIKVEVTKV
jgi:hypothetical protein